MSGTMTGFSGFGLGLRKEHHRDFIKREQPVDFVEIISENFMACGGRPLRTLDAVRERHPVAMHGISMSLGSPEGLDMSLLALEASFKRTRRWAGEAAFTAAACHYILGNAPRSWTLDDFGEGFPELLRELFAEDREVAELAWLEWHMQLAFAAPDLPELDPVALASAGLAAGDWDHLVFSMAAGFAARPIATNCSALWLAMAEETDGEFVPEVSEGTCLAVWRRGLEPHFRVLNTDEHRALAGLTCGESLGGIATGVKPEVLGNWLALWLSEGMFCTFRVQAP